VKSFSHTKVCLKRKSSFIFKNFLYRMDKNDNVQAPTSTGQSSTTGVQSPSTQVVTSPPTSGTNTTGTLSTALGNPGFLQNVQQRIDSMGDDAGSFLVGRYDQEEQKTPEVFNIIQYFFS
jgi:hypothetical protein